MKRIALSLSLFLGIALSSFAQYVVTPIGLKTTQADEKDYYVIEVPNLSQAELYSKTIKFISTVYNSPKDVISGQIENELLTITGLETIFADFDVRYKLNFQFKEGRVRYDMPQIISMRKFQDGKELNLTFSKQKPSLNTVWIFNDKGEVRGMLIPEYKKDLEKLFNSLYNAYETFIKGEETKEEEEW